MVDRLTHLDSTGAARMVDVTDKPVTERRAVATGLVRTTPEVLRLLRADQLPKGDALAVARVAAIGGVKRTADLIPLCHPIAVHGVEVALTILDTGVHIEVRTRTADRTGVEMEALTGVVAAGLSLVDMIKAVDRAATLTDVQLEAKSGGRSGSYTRTPADDPGDTVPAVPTRSAPVRAGTAAAVITCSTRSARGERADQSGALLAAGLRDWGCQVVGPTVVPDDVPAIRSAIQAAVATGARLVLTTGGTGVTPGDLTPEATRPLLDREIPGLAERLRQAVADRVPTAVLSRGLVGLAGLALVVNLPGSPGGARDGLAVLAPVVGHLLDQAAGGDHDPGGAARA